MGNHYTDSDADPSQELESVIEDSSLRDFVRGYVSAMLFTEMPDRDDTGSDASFLDENFDWSDITPESQKAILETCSDFYQAHESDIEEYGPAEAGNDFLFTRNGHGCGFWENDHGTPEICARLDSAAKSEGETYAQLFEDQIDVT